jgi:hypothetical protein
MLDDPDNRLEIGAVLTSVTKFDDKQGDPDVFFCPPMKELRSHLTAA